MVVYFCKAAVIRIDHSVNACYTVNIYRDLQWYTENSLVFTGKTCNSKPLLKFIYSEKATKFCEIFTLLLSYVVPVKSKVSQNYVAFSEYMNFNKGGFQLLDLIITELLKIQGLTLVEILLVKKKSFTRLDLQSKWEALNYNRSCYF